MSDEEQIQMLKLMIGRAGTGKTKYILDLVSRMASRGENTVTIVPEQGSFSYEKVFVKEIAPSNQDRAKVVSFKSLTEDILREYGGGALPQLSDAGRVAVIRKAIRELDDEVRRYARARRDLGLCVQLANVIDEMRNAGVSADLIETAADRADSIKGERLREMAAIYRKSVEDCIEKNLDGPDRMIVAAQRIRESGCFENTTVVMDWFSGFTSPEEEMIRAMIETAKDVVIVLHGSKDRPSVFDVSMRTADMAADYAKQIGIKTETIYFEDFRRFANEGTRNAERLLAGDALSASGEGLYRIDTAGIYEETEAVALEILDLVRNRGYRFRDIAVISNDTEKYRAAINTYFSMVGVPFFCNFASNILYTPVVVFMKDCANLLGSFSTDNILEIMKSPLLGLDPGDTGLVEAYCEVWGPGRDDWTKPFTKNPTGYSGYMGEKETKDLKIIERTRSSVIPKLHDFTEKYRGKAVNDQLLGMIDLLKSFGGVEILKEKCGYDPELARQSNAAFSIMDSISEIFWNEKMSPDDLLNIISIEALATPIKNIPASLDQVMIVSADSGRLDNPRVVFLLGLNDGDFPKYSGASGLISQEERDLLVEAGAPLTICADGKDEAEEYNLYRSLSAASDRVYLCRHEYEGGEKKSPTQLVEKLRELASPPEYLKEDLPGVVNRRTARYEVAKDPDSAGAKLLEAEKITDADDIVSAIKVRDFRIEDLETEEKLLGKIAKLSATKLEQYAKCPLKYYFEYILNIRIPEKAEVTPLSAGNFVHGTMERVMKRVEGDLRTVSEDELRQISNEESDNELRETVGDVTELNPRTYRLFTRLKGQNQRLLLRLREELRQSLFNPTDFELNIARGSEVEPLRLTADDGGEIEIRGKVDRVDVYNSESGKNYIRIIDYKTGTKKFDIKKVRNGEEIQMPLYLVTLCENAKERYGDPLPAGVLYMPSDPSAPDESEDGGKGVSAYTANGIVLSDREVLDAMEPGGEGRYIPYVAKKGKKNKYALTLDEFNSIGEDVRNVVIDSVNRLYGGDISPKPSDSLDSACNYCQYKAACDRNKRGGEEQDDAAD